MRKNINIILLILLSFTIFTSCGKSTQVIQLKTAKPTTLTQSINATSPEVKPYPLEINRYPITNSNQEDQKLPKQGPDFNIDKPVKVSTMTVTGNGPANVPIILVDVSEMGKELAKTTIDDEGKFLFKLQESLIVDHTIGIKLGNLDGTNLDPNDFIYSDSYYDRPMIGVLFDIVRVEE
jgi:hypothetical protein